MALGGLSLESMMAVVQAQSAERRRQAQQAAQPGAQQAQQAQQGAQQAQAPQSDPAQLQQAQQVQQGCALAAATDRNDAAGQQWGEFKKDDEAHTDKPVAAVDANAAAADAGAAARLYAPEQAGDGVDKAPAAAAPAAPTPSKLEALRQAHPELKTNQDLVNHLYKQGGNTWEGASKAGRDVGVQLNSLVRNRQAPLPKTTAPTTTAPTAPTAPTTTAPTTTAPTGLEPRARGVDKPIKGFRDVDVNALRNQLPAQAKDLAQAFVDSGRKHNVDPLALAAIAKHETGNFTSSAFRNKNNAMGISNSRGPTIQPSHEASIDKMAKLLGSTTSGPYKNARTIGETANIYAPIGADNDPRGLNNFWAKGVANFADDFERKVGAAPASTTTAPASTTTGGTQPSGATAAPSGSVADRQNVASGQNGLAQIERTTRAGQRNQMVEGSVTVNGHSYQFRSGGHGRGSLPTGTYNVTRHLDSRSDKASMMVGGVGYSFAMSDKFDPRVGDTRQLLRIHPDGRSAGTEGCMGIVGDAATQRRFRDDMLAEIRRNGGSFSLQVN